MFIFSPSSLTLTAKNICTKIQNMHRHYYTDEEVEDMRQALLAVQRKKKLFVTVREAGEVLGHPTSTSATSYKLNALIKRGMVEKVRNHYHVKETQHVKDIQEPSDQD